ncbi:MAG: MOSC domain-containing protein [Candidatus Omnitrophota bacterium]|nr:MAG: MOSC domain-containing protein [Candidatus Omnitrophota bacterium]
MKKSKIYSINISKTKGTPKTATETAKLIENLGLEQDAHAQGGIKQVSLLSIESIRKQNNCPKIKKGTVLKPGDFAENITTEGIDLTTLKIGGKLTIGKDVILEISKIGKECHKYCAIYYKTGDCIMPREGIFAKVIKGGIIKRNDIIKVEKI